MLLPLGLVDVQSGCSVPMGLAFESSVAARQSVHEHFLAGEKLEEALSRQCSVLS